LAKQVCAYKKVKQGYYNLQKKPFPVCEYKADAQQRDRQINKDL
jgi:hypothetical protein